MRDSTLADKRFSLSYPSDTSLKTEILQVIFSYLTHLQRIQDLGPRKGFHSIVEASHIERTLERYHVPVYDPDAFISYIRDLKESLKEVE